MSERVSVLKWHCNAPVASGVAALAFITSQVDPSNRKAVTAWLDEWMSAANYTGAHATTYKDGNYEISAFPPPASEGA